MLPKAGYRGFTLIEMLVVLLIIGLFAGLVSTISRPDEGAMVRVEAERLAQLLDLAADEARITGRPIGWTGEGSGYRFWRIQDDSSWSEVRDSDLLRARSLPQGMLISGLRVENMRPQDSMRLEFIPYGETLAFALEISLGSRRYSVAASPTGEVRAVPMEGQSGDHALTAMQ